MWGNIATETSYQTNFNVGFSSYRSDTLIHLSQWQYWWWFWFALLWVFYYLIVTRIVRYRSLKMRPKIVTSFRPHGKWGDFLAAIIPVSWCVNILLNSNFILRLTEWQNESSLFTIRIRGRQWYWIYRFELKNFTDIITVPKNIGTNKWVFYTAGELETADDYLHILQLRSQNKWLKKYWSDSLKKINRTQQHHLVSTSEDFKNSLQSQKQMNQFDNSLSSLSLNTSSDFNNLTYFSNLSSSTKIWNKIDLADTNNIFEANENFQNFLLNLNVTNRNLELNKINDNFLTNTISLQNDNNINIINHGDMVESNRFFKRSFGSNVPARLIKYPLTHDMLNNVNTNDLDLFRVRFNESNSIQHKIDPHTLYFTIKQKRYARRNSIAPVSSLIKNDMGQKVNYTNQPLLINNKIFDNNYANSTDQYYLIGKNRKRTENIPVTLAKRMLRTKRTLVLPAHVNITAITNSYDVVHSWFIPGLGIKLDCIPGRSTHHTFYVDNVGFYYGQCAEVCGRYHHHMPIRICALPFEHFLVWWYNFGLPKFLNLDEKRNFKVNYGLRKFVW